MTTTNTSSVANTLQAGIGSELQLEVRENAIVVELCVDYSELPAGNKSHGFAYVTSTMSLSAITSGANEAAAQSVSEVTATVATCTPAVKSAFVVQSWLSIRTSMVNWKEQIPKIMGRAAADLQDVDAASLLAGFNQTAGTSGVNMTIEDARAAILALNTTAKGDAGLGPMFMLHPVQIDDMDADIQGGTGPALSAIMSRADMVSWYGTEPGSGMTQNFRGGLMGIPVFRSNNVPLANGNADRAGALLIPKSALGGKWCWLPRIDTVSAVVNYIAGDVTAITCAYAFVEKFDSHGVTIATDA
jgi:hypothetical protein